VTSFRVDAETGALEYIETTAITGKPFYVGYLLVPQP
jgi:hypothetical protein